MHIDIRPVAKLRGPGAVDIPAALAPVFGALSATGVDLARLRVVCDWIQYRSNFAEPVACRPVLAEPAPAGPPTLRTMSPTGLPGGKSAVLCLQSGAQPAVFPPRPTTRSRHGGNGRATCAASASTADIISQKKPPNARGRH